jgi:hypothetical protein
LADGRNAALAASTAAEMENEILKRGIDVAVPCRLLGVSRSGYYEGL